MKNTPKTELDRLLGQDLLSVPADFSHRVMQSIKPLPMPFEPPRNSQPPPAANALQTLLLRLGMLGSGLLGLSQVARFVFGLWAASSVL